MTLLEEEEQEFIANNKRTIWMGSPSLHPRQFTNLNLNFGESAIFTLRIAVSMNISINNSNQIMVSTIHAYCFVDLQTCLFNIELIYW